MGKGSGEIFYKTRFEKGFDDRAYVHRGHVGGIEFNFPQILFGKKGGVLLFDYSGRILPTPFSRAFSMKRLVIAKSSTAIPAGLATIS